MESVGVVVVMGVWVAIIDLLSVILDNGVPSFSGFEDHRGCPDKGHDVNHATMDVISGLWVSRFDNREANGMTERVVDLKGLLFDALTTRAATVGLRFNEMVERGDG